jgi:hypothetical protein
MRVRQPRLGVAGIALVVPVALALGVGLGSMERSLLILGPISTFALPAIAMIAFWWQDWPGTRLRQPLTGVADTLLVVAAGVLLTIAGQAVVGHVDLRGVFDPAAPPARVPTFPATMTLAAAIFIAMLQLTLVCERRPLRALAPIPGGLAALAIAWATGVALYELVVGTGLLAGGELGSLLVCIGALQVTFHVMLRGWPFTGIHSVARRLATANAALLGGGAGAYLALAGLASLPPDPITAIAGSVVAGGLIVGVQFEGWTDAVLDPARSRAAQLAAAALLSALVYLGLQGIAGAGSWTRAEPDEWTAYAGLNAIGVGVLLHVAIGQRWPFASAIRRWQGPLAGRHRA